MDGWVSLAVLSISPARATSSSSRYARPSRQGDGPLLPGGAPDRVLVVINLQGGNDGLNTLVPHGMPQYYRYRPGLAIAQNDVLQLDAQVGFNCAKAYRSTAGIDPHQSPPTRRLRLLNLRIKPIA